VSSGSLGKDTDVVGDADELIHQRVGLIRPTALGAAPIPSRTRTQRSSFAIITGTAEAIKQRPQRHP
jgi:hypothetical protein